MRVAALWLAAALISGFTLRRYIGPLDEGILMQAAARMADGQWPWRDFSWAYGPGEPLFVLATGKSLASWRLLRVAADATAAVLVWALVRDVRPRWAFAAWAAVAVTAAQPTSANPTGPALAFALGAVLLATRDRAALAGVAAGAAAFWRPDVGACAALAAALTLLVAARSRGAAASAGPGVGEGTAEATPGPRVGDGTAAATAGPRVGEGTAEATPGPRVGDGTAAATAGPRVDDGTAARCVPAAAGGRGARRSPRGGLRAAAPCLLAAAVTVAFLYAPFVIAAGPARVWDALVVQGTRDGDWWRLPFPDGFHGTDVKDFLTWLAPYAALVVLALAAVQRRALGLVVLGLGAAAYFVSRADLEHAQALLIVAAALAALIEPRIAGAAVLALLIVIGAGNRAGALLRPPDLRPLGAVRVPPGDAEAIPKVKALVDRLVPPGEPIYVAPRRSDLVTFSNPLLHYFVDRPNVLHRDVLLQAKPEEQEKIIRALAGTRVVIRWTAPESAQPEPNRRGRPSGSRALDDYLRRTFRLRARYGDYEVLERASATSSR